MTKRQEAIKSISIRMAAAYWRGKLDSDALGISSEMLETLIAAAAEKEWQRWGGAATAIYEVATA